MIIQDPWVSIAVFPERNCVSAGKPTTEPVIEIRLTETGDAVAYIKPDESFADTWKEISVSIPSVDGVNGLYFIYHGIHNIQIKDIIFKK